ncbi:MAG: translation initiation factor IF-3 [Oscillospiraceae bacterium]
MSNTTHQLNEEIRDKEIRLIGADGEQLGVMATAAAMDLATEQDLDLVKISPTAVPPVCKLMNYGKFRFEQAKREKEARKNQHVVEIKEVRMSPGIDSNDFNVKLRNAQKFLSEGDRVKATVRFRGREMAHTDIGRRLLIKFSEDCTAYATVEKDPKLDGRHMSMFLSPKVSKDAVCAAKEAAKEAKDAAEATAPDTSDTTNQ